MSKYLVSGLVAYVLWGIFPLYFYFLKSVPALEVLCHRIVWSSVCLYLTISIRRHDYFDWLKSLITKEPKYIIYCAITGLLICANWFIYIYAVQKGRVLESSFGYFLCPIIMILFGILFFGEKINRIRVICIALLIVGVSWPVLSGSGRVSWISLVLAFSFAGYSALHKRLSKIDASQKLFIETTLLTPIALAYLLYLANTNSLAWLSADTTRTQDVLLICAGIVTSLPLVLFSFAASGIPLQFLGMIQYLAPTLQFLLGLFFFKELLQPDQLVSFSLIWIAIVIYISQLYRSHRKKLK